MFESFLKPTITTPTLTGSIVTFNAQYALPLKSHTVALTATQSGSGTPSPDNVRTISGYSAIHIGNISDNTNINFFQGLLNGTYGFLDLSSLEWIYDSPYTRFNTNVARIKPMATPRTGDILCSRYQTINDGRPVGNVPDKSIYQGSGTDLSIKDTSYTDATIFRNSLNGVYLIYELATPTTPSFTSAEFEALCEAFGMNGQSFSIQIGSTVYGGEYDAKTGLFTVTNGYLDLGSVNWDKYTNANKTYFRTTSEVADMKKSNNPNALQGLVCSIYPEATWSQAVDSAGYNEVICKGWSGRSYIAIADTNYDNYTTSDFKTAMSGVQLVYELATPTTIQLPPCPIDTIANSVNNIWADTGDTTLQYIKLGST